MSTPEEAARQIMDWVDRGAYAGTDQVVIVARAYLELVRREAKLREALKLNYRVVCTLENMAEHPTLTVVKQIEAAQDAARAALADKEPT